jgi:hypothetical protein
VGLSRVMILIIVSSGNEEGQHTREKSKKSSSKLQITRQGGFDAGRTVEVI